MPPGVATGVVEGQLMLVQKQMQPAIDACDGYAVLTELTLRVAKEKVLNEPDANVVAAEGQSEMLGMVMGGNVPWSGKRGSAKSNNEASNRCLQWVCCDVPTGT
jgi:hypothetical protein